MEIRPDVFSLTILGQEFAITPADALHRWRSLDYNILYYIDAEDGKIVPSLMSNEIADMLEAPQGYLLDDKIEHGQVISIDREAIGGWMTEHERAGYEEMLADIAGFAIDQMFEEMEGEFDV